MSKKVLHTYRDHLAPLYQEDLKGIHRERGTNAGLWLDKYSKDQDQADNGDQERKESKEQNRAKTSNRSALVAEVAAIAPPGLYQQFYARWEQMLDEAGAWTQEARVKGRMIVGLGDESVLETSIALHYTYGVPYIPGSALKGLAASYARQRLGPEWQKDQEAYKIVFGDTKEAGYITFFDALYLPDSGHNKRALYSDIITVHHPDYYQGQKNATPSDWDSPTPIPFLSATGVYLIALAAPDLEEDGQWIKKVFEILGYALGEMGIGAKTSSGYGRIEFV